MTIFEELSFREKSILVSFVAVLFAYGGYFANLLSGVSLQTLSAMLSASLGVVVLLITIEIALHIALSIFDSSDACQKDDERDFIISGRAARISQTVLSVGVVLVLGHIVIVGAWNEEGSAVAVSLFEVANVLLFTLVLSELVNYGSQLYFYRRGV